MKSLNTIILTLIASATIPAFANTSSTKSNEIQKRKELTVQLQIQKKKLLEEIAVNTILAEQLATEVEFIEDYASNDLDLSTILAEYPVAAEGTFIAAVGAAAKFFNVKFVSPALLKQNAGVIVRLMQRFPKLSKSTAWVTGLVAAAATTYYTIDRAMAFAELETKTSEQIGALYAEKVAELNMRRDTVAIAVSELLGLNQEIGLLQAKEVERAYDMLLNPSK